MIKRFSKIVIAAVLCVVIAVSSCVSFGAKIIESEDKSIIFYDDTITIDNNEVYVCADNIDEEQIWSVGIKNEKSDESYFVKATDCIDNPQVIKTIAGEKYISSLTKSGYIYKDRYCDFATTGGEYRKVRAKLHMLNNYFNEDGSRSNSNSYYSHDYYFGGLEIEDDFKFWSCLMIVSGGVINFVAPDENGYVEIYVSTDIRYNTSFYTDFAYDGGRVSGGGGGYCGGTLYGLRKGTIDGSKYSPRVMDVTAIQRNVAKLQSFDSIQTYRADIDSSGVIDIMDASLIQQYLAMYD